jgi:hypothetical protein
MISYRINSKNHEKCEDEKEEKQLKKWKGKLLNII